MAADTSLQTLDDEDAGRSQSITAVPKQSPAEKVAHGSCRRRISMVGVSVQTRFPRLTL